MGYETILGKLVMVVRWEW